MSEIVVGADIVCLDCGKQLGNMTEKLKDAMEYLNMEDEGWYCSLCFHKSLAENVEIDD